MKSILSIIICMILLSCEKKQEITPNDAYAIGWRDGFVRGLEKQNWRAEEWREQLIKDSLKIFN